MKTTVLYEDREDVKTKIVLAEHGKLRYIHIYQFDDEGYVENDMRIFNEETVDAFTQAFAETTNSIEDYSEYWEPIGFFKD